MSKIPITEDDAKKGPQASAAHDNPSAGQSDGDDSMASLQADIDRFRDLAARSQADFENYKKRCAREKEEGIKYANTSLLEKLLPIIDNFELGLSAARGESEESPIYSGMKIGTQAARRIPGRARCATHRSRRPEIRSEFA